MAVELKRPGKTKVVVSDTSYASVAEDLMGPYACGAGKKLTTTKLRSIYALITNVYTQVNTPEEFDQHFSDIQYLKVRMAYEAGRETVVRDFLEVTGLLHLVDAIASFEQFKLYCRYAEALVAFFKYFCREDK